jgi:hypothetical protein
VRAALISIAETPSLLAGKSLARRQLDFALAAGCERVIALGNGGSAAAIALRHAVEARGARFQCIGDTHGLLGAVPAADELLVLAPGLLAEDTRALEALERGSAVLVLPAGPGVAAGFERIDLERAWAGALLLPGRLVERLADLASDSEATAALLRIALQARVAEKRLPEEALAEGSWAVLGDAGKVAQSEEAWLKRNLLPANGSTTARQLAQLALRPLALRLLGQPQALSGLWAGIVAALGGGVAATALGGAGTGFVLVALAALLAEFAAGLAYLRDAPFAPLRRRWHEALAPCLVDAGLTVCAALAIDGSWPHRVFAPLVLLGVLHACRAGQWPNLAALLGDRALLALAFGVAAAFGLVEPAVMAVCLATLGLDAAVFRGKSRITPI